MTNAVETSTPAKTPNPIGPYNHIAKVGKFISIGGTAGVNPVTGSPSKVGTRSAILSIWFVGRCSLWRDSPMLLDQVFAPFIKAKPICVMARAVLQRLLDPHYLDQLFARAARRQYTHELLFSTLVDLL